MSDVPSIQWFPGHMAKTRRLMKENLPLVDLVAELRDARVPYSSSNPEIEKLIGKKPRLILLNKSDMADPAVTRQWVQHYKTQGIPVMETDCRSGRGVKEFPQMVEKVLAELFARRRAKGIKGKPVAVMVVGVPNVGKSSFINRMAGSKRTGVADRPGVTRGKQWVKVNQEVDMLDMPGVLWPKFDDPAVGEKLAFTGAVKDNVVDMELLACRLLEFLNGDYRESLCARYKLEDTEGKPGHELLELVGRRRGMLLPGGAADTERAAVAVLDEFREGRIGRITLETPEVLG